MPYPILGTPKPAFFDSSGSPLVSGTLSILDPADDTNKASYPTYDDAVALTNANSNPITLDGRGETTTELWGLDGQSYKVVLKDSDSNTIWTADDVLVPIILPYLRTATEIAAGVTPTNYEYPPGHVNRYGTNTTPGTTNMSAAWQAALDVVDQSGGGEVIANYGEIYLLSSQVTATLTQSGDYSNIVVDGKGCILKTSGAISALKVTGGGTLGNVTVKNIKVDHRANADATYGFDLLAAQMARIVNCQFKAGGGTSATYACVHLGHGTDADASTGSFWVKIRDCQFRTLTGGDAKYQYGILLEGTNNASIIDGCAFTGAEEAVRLKVNATTGTITNSLLINDCHFETNTDAITNVGAASLGGVGPIIRGCRFESNTNAYNESGYNTESSQPVTIKDCHWITGGGDITNTSTNRQAVVDLDLITPDLNTDNVKRSRNGWTYWSNDAPVHKLRATASGANVTEWWDNSGSAVRVAMHYVSGSIYKLYATVINNGLILAGVRSINGGSAREGNNLSGSATLSSGTAAVSFGTAEPDANYNIYLTGDTAETFTWASKATSGFTINSSNGSSTANVDWLIIGD